MHCVEQKNERKTINNKDFNLQIDLFSAYMYDICYYVQLHKYSFWYRKERVLALKMVIVNFKMYNAYLYTVETFPYLINSFSFFIKFEFLLVLSKIMLNCIFVRIEFIYSLENANAKVLCLFDGIFFLICVAKLQIIRLFIGVR